MSTVASPTFVPAAVYVPRARRLLTWLTHWFSRDYWFAAGCSRSYEYTRYIFALLYLYLANGWIGIVPPRFDIEAYLRTRSPEMYRPLGPFYLLDAVPTPLFYHVCFWLLRICPITLLLGFFSRLSLAGCTVGLFGLGILFYSYDLEWSHGFQPILIPSLALLFGPRHTSGFDGWLGRRWHRERSPAEDGRARAAVLATQLLIGLVFANAVFYKAYAYGEGFRHFLPWALSDNLRNVIIRQQVVLNTPMPDAFRFIVTHDYAYRGLALGNLVAQLLPLGAFFLMNRPWLRLLCGMAFGSEVLGLGVVMGIWNPHWLLLILVFLDWDRLIFRQKAPAEPASARPWTGAAKLHAAILVLLVSFNVFVMFTHLHQRQWTFPFTSYPMFSQVVCERPFRQHLPFYIPVARFEFEADKPLPACYQDCLWPANWGITWIEDTRSVNEQNLRHMESMNGCAMREMRAYRALLRVPEYPACDPQEVLKLLVYQRMDGHCRTVTSGIRYDPASRRRYIEFQPYGFESPQIRMKYCTGEGAGPFDLPGEIDGGRCYFDRPDSRKVIAVFEVTEPGRPPVLFGGPML